jgi:hypothetical protein
LDIGTEWKNIEPFFSVHGKCLTELHLSSPPAPILSLVLSTRSSLQEVAIRPEVISKLTSVLPNLPFIFVYPGMVFDWDSRSEDLRGWNESMQAEIDHNVSSTLSTIRLPNFNLEDLPSFIQFCPSGVVESLRHWTARCKVERVRLEFRTGELVDIADEVNNDEGPGAVRVVLDEAGWDFLPIS